MPKMDATIPETDHEPHRVPKPPTSSAISSPSPHMPNKSSPNLPRPPAFSSQKRQSTVSNSSQEAQLSSRSHTLNPLPPLGNVPQNSRPTSGGNSRTSLTKPHESTSPNMSRKALPMDL